MHPRPAHQTLQPHRRVDQLANLRIRLVRLPQRTLILERLLDRDPDRRRDHLRDAIDFAIGHIQRATHILDRRLRRHRVERDDLRDLVDAILAPHILDHLAAPVHAEVDIDIRHRHPLRIQKPLKQQIVLQRIHIGNLHAVRDKGAGGRPTPRPHRNALLLRVPDKVPHDHEVAGKLHLLDAGNLPIQPRPVLLFRMLQQIPRTQVRHIRRQPLTQPVPAHLLEKPVQIHSLRHRKFRKRVVHLVQLQIAALGKLHRPRNHMRRVREQPRHLVRALNVELVGIELEPLRVVHRPRRLHAQQHLMRPAVLIRDVVRVVRRDQRNIQILLHPEHRLGHRLIRFQPMILDFQKEVSAPEHLLVRARRRPRFLVLAVHQVL